MKAAQQRRRRACELCGGAAALRCEADAAFLCWRCDARVHSANFLVARHLRHVACSRCGALDDDRLLTGAGAAGPVRSLCRACGAAAAAAAAAARSEVSSDESDSGSCVSTAESAASARPSGARRPRGGGAASRVRLAAAADVCSGARRRQRRRRRACEEAVIRSLEAATGVPARLLVRSRAAIAIALEEEEGWAECC